MSKDLGQYFGDLAFGLKTLCGDMEGIIASKKAEAQESIKGTAQDKKDEKTTPFKSMMSTTRFISNAEKKEGVDVDEDKILKALDKLFGG